MKYGKINIERKISMKEELQTKLNEYKEKLASVGRYL